MAIFIDESLCINCGNCLTDCPNHAIFEDDQPYNFREGTSLKEIETEDGNKIPATTEFPPISTKTYYIVPEKCTECTDHAPSPTCASVCPVDCCLPDENHVEDKETLRAKKMWMHGPALEIKDDGNSAQGQ